MSRTLNEIIGIESGNASELLAIASSIRMLSVT